MSNIQRKRVSITSKRQFTIPQKFYTELGFGNEAICTMKDGVLIIEPARTIPEDEFAEQILEDLIYDGYSGIQLLDKFKERRAQLRPAVEKLLDAAEDAANGKDEYYTSEEVFKEEK